MTDTTRLPDFIFARDPEVEQREGHALAGRLITNICRSCGEPTSAQRQLVKQIIESLIETAAHNPDFDEAEIWLGGAKPADGAVPPFKAELLKARCAACLIVVVRVDRSPSPSVH
jgi:hypothetical protein